MAYGNLQIRKMYLSLHSDIADRFLLEKVMSEEILAQVVELVDTPL